MQFVSAYYQDACSVGFDEVGFVDAEFLHVGAGVVGAFLQAVAACFRSGEGGCGIGNHGRGSFFIELTVAQHVWLHNGRPVVAAAAKPVGPHPA